MVLSMDRWVGKVAIVTGASAGIGAAIAEELVGQGLKVVGLARRKDLLDELSRNLSDKKGKLYSVEADMTKEEDILKAFKWVKDNLGPVHILINNAGTGTLGPLSDSDTEGWRHVLNLNVLGLCIATREAVKDMKENNVDGHIIHINSTVGHQVPPSPSFNVYPASKFAVRALAETLRLELMNSKSKIKITNISPGLVLTEIISKMATKLFTKPLSELHAMEPANIADAVVYALSTPPHVQVQELTIRGVIENFD